MNVLFCIVFHGFKLPFQLHCESLYLYYSTMQSNMVKIADVMTSKFAVYLKPCCVYSKILMMLVF